jgi:hypothetical protein
MRLPWWWLNAAWVWGYLITALIVAGFDAGWW